MRFFNTAGPVKPDIHYTVPPLSRFDLDEMLLLIQQQKYFVLHAPRQVGKTSYLLALSDYLNRQDTYRALYINVEAAQAMREDVDAAMQAILGRLASAARDFLQDSFPEEIVAQVRAAHGGASALEEMLTRWAEQSPKPLVLLIDEIDSLIGDTLISVLRQLRSGYYKRPEFFPQSIILCGVRDVRDYRIQSNTEKTVITGGSAFNIKATSLRLHDFTRAEVEQLYAQHTQESGQPFAAGTMDLVWDLTQGQPWLVNALAYEACFANKAARDRTKPVTVAMIQQAKEQLILRRETHLDQLADKLQEERVRRVIEPILAGESDPELIRTDDLQYVRDLGLIRAQGHAAIANKIYQEVIPRELTYSTQLTITHETSWYVAADGRLDMVKLLTAFQSFFREHSEHWLERFSYKEAGPQLLLQAFLQRVLNGGGRIEREYGLGRERTDLLIFWPCDNSGTVQKVVLELKIRYRDLEKTIQAGLEQTWRYMDRAETAEGHLIIFDRTPDKPWVEKVFQRTETHNGVVISVWGM